MYETILEAFEDSFKILIYLFITYLVMEALERYTGSQSETAIERAGKIGPLIGGVIGAFPQCGFSVAASNLYAGRIISIGTLIAVFLSTSDEMLPILISSSIPIKTMVSIVVTKGLIGILAGFIIDMAIRSKGESHIGVTDDVHGHSCDSHGCGNHHHGVLATALWHTAKIFFFILIISIAINIAIYYMGEDTLKSIFSDKPIIANLSAALIGLIPNCASSVVITQLYVDNIINSGAMMSGLLTGAGVGTLVLARELKKKKEFLYIIALLYTLGVAGGIMINLIGIDFNF